MTKPLAKLEPRPTEPKPEGTSGPLDELIARFQLETDQKLAAIEADHRKASVEQERKIAALSDQWTTLGTEVQALRKEISGGLHLMHQGVAEVNNALREAVKHSQKASDSVAVFDKLKASQPDFHKMVRELEKKVAGVQDKATALGDTLNTLSRRLDEFEVVTEDYEETKGQVRSIDGIVKDLNASERRRKQSVA